MDQEVLCGLVDIVRGVFEDQFIVENYRGRYCRVCHNCISDNGHQKDCPIQKLINLQKRLLRENYKEE